MLVNKASHLLSPVISQGMEMQSISREKNLNTYVESVDDAKLNSSFSSKLVEPLISHVSHSIPTPSSGFP